MATIYLRKEVGGLVPDGDQDRERLKKFALGSVVKAEIKKTRNYGNHKRLFALLVFISETSDLHDNTEKALEAVKMASGHVDWLPNPMTGEMYPKTRSINYESMDEVEFSEWFERAIDATIKHITPQMNRIAVDRALEMVATW